LDCWIEMRPRRLSILACLTALHAGAPQAHTAAQAPAAATFKSSVDLVRVSAVVRDRSGRFVQNLGASDFEVRDQGQARAIADFRHDLTAVSVALLFDVSGSMATEMASARQAGTLVLRALDPARDQAGIFTFDTRLEELAPFGAAPDALPDVLSALRPFGATSLHDAIAAAAGRVAARDEPRRAVVVVTDGHDNASRLTSGDVSSIASAIDVPVYIIRLVSSIESPSAGASMRAARVPGVVDPLADLAAWTGGHAFAAGTPATLTVVAREIVSELRHQYLIAFESSSQPGWRPIEVRVRRSGAVVRARSGYIAGHARPSSHQEN
jgi:VWFA-related protein